LLRKTEDIVHKVEGCQDLVQLSTPLPSVSAAMASSTGLDAITLPVALVATGAVVGAGATTAMTAPVAARATPRPSTSRPGRRHVLRTRRVWRAYVHDHPRRARRPSRAHCPRPRRAPAFAAPQRPPPPPRPGCADAAGAAGAAGAGGRRQSRSRARGATGHAAVPRGGACSAAGRPAAPSPPLAWSAAAPPPPGSPGSSQLPGSLLAVWGRCGLGPGPWAAKFSLLGSIHAAPPARRSPVHACAPRSVGRWCVSRQN
jgi:hypothetical protein